MEVVDHVLAERLGHVAKASGQPELQPHHGKAGIAERHRELGREVAAGRERAKQQRE